CCDTGCLKSVDLIFHQRDQGRHDDRKSGTRERGQLEAQRLAAASGKDREDVLPRQRVQDDILLQRTKRSEPEEFLQEFATLACVTLHHSDLTNRTRNFEAEVFENRLATRARQICRLEWSLD